ncbi:Mce family protein [Gordonia effusa NBRC 100432]|uniref:Mce family protein n=1 Tax=Gordonia effusa NBRC 100432 TaxID=1077974 RepID=H0R402_9ACTN|nr:MlaD family protein [Gordonia effusa]GAB19803.1 Mce family protein [Gordonia effusa NBRC 100432]
MKRILPALILPAIGVLAAAYLAVSVVQYTPWKSRMTFGLTMPDSGGLLSDSPVLLRGVRIGKVTSVVRENEAVRVTMDVESGAKIPTRTGLRVESMSLLGEPYVNFAPDQISGPFLHDGSQLTYNSDGPASLTEIASASTKLVANMDPKALSGLMGGYLRATENVAAIDILGRSADLLAAAILARRATTRQLLADLDWLSAKTPKLGRQLTTTAPQWNQFGSAATEVIRAADDLARAPGMPDAYSSGNGLQPFLVSLRKKLDAIGAQVGPIAPLLVPLTSLATATFRSVDLSMLIAQGLGTVDSDGGLNLTMKAVDPASPN